MDHYFHVWKDHCSLYILPNERLVDIQLFLDHEYITGSSYPQSFSIRLDADHTYRTLMATGQLSEYTREKVEEWYTIETKDKERDRRYQSGDILVASDNVNSQFTGYMGHAALVISQDQLIESPGIEPAIAKDSIDQFLAKHPIHAQYRPKDAKRGQKAAQFAIQYYQQFQENLKNGIQKPTFSFDLSQSLDEPWEHIYCSKLIWLAYHYGAGYTFENDDWWFAPEDLYNHLKNNESFIEIYKHPDVQFHINI
ncbi:hypothetical protein J416_11292 [Gracilibacillus halophilus YIM-C55.5]|uniref:Uncharacterized protein n=1 Tax=Gracilibacillus halophilus YIM-C55.5 TaxID=1308866 RepID=N4WT50_9BACI|nr:hypothetical protein [Gracilibacillus halophilus]ENH96346.1 hypothetical protein J416_11292 [Gracilibacillus halophilus YIM-C55.5]